MTPVPPFLRVPASSLIGGGGAARSPRRLERSLRWIVAGFLSVVFCQASSFAVDRVFLEAGAGHEGDLIRIGAQWEFWERNSANDKWHLGASLEVDLGYWNPELGDNDLWEIGVTPVFQVAPNRPSSSRLIPFLEAGLGAHLLSNVRFSNLYLSTSLQFGSHIGAGIHFGRDRKFTLVYRFQHLSNASVKQPNPGIEFHLLQFGFRVSPRR